MTCVSSKVINKSSPTDTLASKHRKPLQKTGSIIIPSSSSSSKELTVGASVPQIIPIVPPLAKTLNPLFIPLPNKDVVDQASSDKSSVNLSKDGEVDSLKNSLKLKERSTNDDALNVSFKAANDYLEKDTDMTGEESKSINPPEFDAAMSISPTLVVISEGVIPASITKQVPKKGGIGLSADVEMINPDKKLSDNNATNAKTSVKSLVLNKVVTPS